MRVLLSGVLFAAILSAPSGARASENTAKPEAVTPAEAAIHLGKIALKRGQFEARFLAPASAAPRAIVILGSGDGGWSYWEDRVLRHLSTTCAVVGVDFSKYAETDYDQVTLAEDFSSLADWAKKRLERKDAAAIPIIYGGWSMGAEQSVAASGLVERRPKTLAGLLLVASGARGRYGLRLTDRAGIAPRGDGTFGLVDFAGPLKGLRLAQFHARYDLLDTPDWAEGLDLTLRRFDLPRGFHDFEGAGPDFLKLVDQSLEWILEPAGAAANPGPVTTP